MPKVLSELPAPLDKSLYKQQKTLEEEGTRSARVPDTDRVGWGVQTTDAQLQAALEVYGERPNSNQAGEDRAACMQGDLMRYARLTYNLVLTIDQASGILDRTGWLTYSACAWVDRLVQVGCKDLE